MNVLVACEYSAVVRDAFRAIGHSAWSCDLLPCEGDKLYHIQGDCLEAIRVGRPTDGAKWDLMIAHPPCTYLSVSGMHWTARGLRDPQLTEDALAFVQALMDAPIPRIAVENPVSVISSRIRKPDQIIQPWMFGHDASKKTCLWLKNLPKLERLHVVTPPRGWKQVSFAGDCLNFDGELDELGDQCSICGLDYSDCECPGPTHDEVTEYKTIDGVLFATFEKPPRRPIWANQTEGGQNKLAPSADRWKERSRTFAGVGIAMAEQWGSWTIQEAEAGR
jgi:hypothetical protein